ncbi:PIG-L deacetylase family protein [Streptomyces sp. NPDC057433]|uniref:PIG-L deacetylase family protein n=1 Tax=Streptomyces sp. NPDC057433 TaxID=3346132 RepID=UPI0036C1F7C0
MTTPAPPPSRPDLPSVLGAFARPDDESLLGGGVLAQHATAGARTAVVTTPRAPDGPRAAEFAAAPAVLGADEPRMPGYSDARNESSAPGQPRWRDVNVEDAVAQLVGHIRRFRPVVVAHDVLGQFTGHPDHRRTHQVALLAVEAAGVPHLHPAAGGP